MSRLAASVGAINLGQGFPEGFEPPALIDAAAEALRTGSHQYPPAQGLPALLQAVAENAARFAGLHLDPEREVLVTSGATEALFSSFLALIEPGDEAIILEPAYDSYAPVLARAGARVVPVRLAPPDWALPEQALRAAITDRTRLIVVNTPMNPIGKVFSDEEIDLLARLANAHDLIVVSDEVYEHLVFDGQPFRSLLAHPGLRERAVRIGSAGKSFSVTGWKVGYVSAAPALLAPILRAHQYVTFTTPPALQATVAVGLRFPDSYFLGLKAELQARRDSLRASLQQAGFQAPPVAATYFATVDISALDPGGDDLAFCQRLVREAGVAAIPVSGFYQSRDIKTHIRFCFAKPAPLLAEAARRLADWRAANPSDARTRTEDQPRRGAATGVSP
jgi:aspartate/methionine/tyrosine aminotransferase